MILKNKNYVLKVINALISMLIIFCWNAYNPCKGSATPTEGDLYKVILIDPGHGGIDGGAVSKSGTVEKDINLSISIKVKERLKALGYEVLMTREEDKGLYTDLRDINRAKTEDLNNRCKMKRESNCDVFISIHQNFFSQSSCSGSQVWYSKNENSKKLASLIQENFKRDLNSKNKRIEKEANGAYKILRCYTNIPSVIVECGFLTNPAEEKKLKSEDYQNKIADSLVKSVKEYFATNKECFLAQ